MGSNSHNVVLGCALMFFVAFVCLSHAHIMDVGGKDGWTLQPNNGLNHWAAENRFQINDTLLFKYKKREDSVLVVHKRGYYHCNKTSPIHNLTDGHSRIKLTRSGEFYFISGHADNCVKGQKLIVVVLSLNHTNVTSPTNNVPPPTISPTSGEAPPSPAAAAPKKSAATAVRGHSLVMWGFITLLMAPPLFLMS